jgi:molybdate transport system substrate-binding protein
MSPRRARRAALVLAVLGAPAPLGAETLRVFAAASLTDAFREIAAAFEQRNPGVRVELNLAGTQVLRTQVEQGAAADVFAAADLEHAEALRRQGLLGPHRVFARNRLVVAVPSGSSRVRGLADLAVPGVKVVLAAPAVPAGRYALEALSRMENSGRYGPAYRERVERNVVSQETNVRAVLAKVAMGEADAGVVYATDAAAAGAKVGVLAMPADLDVEVVYPIGILSGSRSPAARAFVDEVTGPRGQATLRRHGFLP